MPVSRQSEQLSWRSEQQYFVDDQPRIELVRWSINSYMYISFHIQCKIPLSLSLSLSPPLLKEWLIVMFYA